MKRMLAALCFGFLSGCTTTGPTLSELDCTRDVGACFAKPDTDAQGIWIVTDTNLCARVELDNRAPIAVCGGRRLIAAPNAGGSWSVSACQVCPHR